MTVTVPLGATLVRQAVYGTALLSWTPTASDVRTDPYAVTFTVSDDGNGNPALIASGQQTIHLRVRATVPAAKGRRR